jgi:hypothetical protein
LKKHALGLGLVLATVMTAACAHDGKGTDAPATETTVSTTPVTSASTSASTSAATPATAPKLSPELAKLAGGAPLVAGPFAWPKGGSSALVGGSPPKLVWHDANGEGSRELPRRGTKAFEKDVDKDGTTELVVVADGAPSDSDPSSLFVFGVAPTTKKPTRMPLVELQTLGANDEASLDRELAVKTLGALTAPPLRLIARLPLATPDELKALVGAAGVKSCTRMGAKKNCTPVATAKIDAAKVAALVKLGGTLEPFDPEDGDITQNLQGLSCAADDKNPKLVTCTASIGGPAGGQWTFEKTATGVRLAEVWSWGETS